MLLRFFLLLLVCSCESPLLEMRDAPKVRMIDKLEGKRLLKSVDLYYSWDWVSEPNTQTEGKAIIRFFNVSDGEIQALGEGIGLHAFLWMPHHGHGSAPIEIKMGKNNTYEVNSMWFIMPGTWDIHIQIQDRGRVIDEDFISITL